MTEAERRYQRALLDLRIACDEELQRHQAGRSPDPGLIVTMAMGEVRLAFDGLKTWDCGYCRDRPTRLVPCPECGG